MMNFISKPNSWVSQDAAPATQLRYGLQLDPAPFTVSVPQEDPVLGSLELVITNPTANPLSVTSISITIQVGTDSGALTPSTAGIMTGVSDPTDWIVTPPPSPVTNGAATYVLGPSTGTAVTLAAGASVVLQIFQVQTGTSPGNSTIGVKEMIGSTPGFTSFLVTTFPTGFYFNGLSASVASGSGLTPVAQLATGSTVTLTWNASVVDVGAFTILYSDAAQGQQTATPTTVGEWTSPPLTSDTIFTVAVTTSVNEGEPLTAALSTSVSVQNPTLVAASILAGTAIVSGATTLSSGVTIAYGAGISGGLTSDTITATGTLGATGTITAGGALTVAGALTASGGAALTGGISGDNLTLSGGVTASSAALNGGVSANYVAVNAPTGRNAVMVAGTGTSSGTQAVFVMGVSNYGSGSAIVASAQSAWQAITAINSSSNPNNTTGVYAAVATGDDWGLCTNGKCGGGAGDSLLTHVETRDGHRVVGSPLSFAAEFHASGDGRLRDGVADIRFADALADVIHHSDEQAYRVQITPTAHCRGMAVTAKSAGGFRVEELGRGTSDASFDWFLVAARPAALGSSERRRLPERLPQALQPSEPG